VELLVVIAIISILAAMLMPALEGALGQARRVECLNQQRQLLSAALLYANDSEGALPHTPDWSDKSWAGRVAQDSTDPWPAQEPFQAGHLFAAGYLPMTQMVLLCCPDFEIVPAASGSSHYANAFRKADAGRFRGWGGVDKFCFFSVVYRNRSALGDSGRLASRRLQRNPQLFADVVTLQKDGTFAKNWSETGGYGHGLAGVNVGFVDGHAGWAPLGLLRDGVGWQQNLYNHQNIGNFWTSIRRADW
jgi:competence protein ComGC